MRVGGRGGLAWEGGQGRVGWTAGPGPFTLFSLGRGLSVALILRVSKSAVWREASGWVCRLHGDEGILLSVCIHMCSCVRVYVDTHTQVCKL